MNLYLVSTSADPQITADVLGKIAAALEVQLMRDYAGFSQSAGATVAVAPTLADVPKGGSAIVIADQPAEADELGDHETDDEGRPVGRIFWAPIRDNGGTLMTGPLCLSATISHEALEMLGDPYINGWFDGPDAEYAAELCDPVESDAYDIDGVSVSNFVGPRYFSDGAGPYDFLGKLSAPWTMTSGGYLIQRVNGTVSQVFGEHFPEWKKPHKSRAAKRKRGRKP